jgi:hypothetical protein
LAKTDFFRDICPVFAVIGEVFEGLVLSFARKKSRNGRKTSGNRRKSSGNDRKIGETVENFR